MGGEVLLPDRVAKIVQEEYNKLKPSSKPVLRSNGVKAVSYTHLDVYKRQHLRRRKNFKILSWKIWNY